MSRSGSLSALAAAIVLTAPAAAGAERVVTRPVHLPATITQVQFPSYTADGSRILAAAQSSQFAGMQLVSFTQSGTGLRCLTCGHGTDGPLQKMFPFPDGRRILVRIGVQSAGTAADHGVVECSPSVLHCDDATVVPIEAPFTDDPNVVEAQREFRISPDGKHVALTQIRSTHRGQADGVAIVGRLVRGSNVYRVADPRVVATGCELKNFTPDGRGVLIARYTGVAEAANPDIARVNLRTRRETRVTYWPDWEEDIDIAARPYHGRSWFVVGSARGSGLLETVAQIRRPLAITPAISGLPFRLFALKQAEIAEPWINSLSAERHRRMGTPLAPGAVAAGWNSRANFSWKPDGTAVVFWQRGVEDPDKTRVVVSRLPQRPSGKAPKVRPTGTPRWAPRLNGYFPPTQRWPRSRRGRVSGRMIVEVHAAPATSKYRRFIHVRYRNFADRRGFVIHGVESGYYDLSGFFGGDSLYSARLTVSGRHHGFLAASKVAINAGSIDGTIASRLDGHRLRLGPLP